MAGISSARAEDAASQPCPSCGCAPQTWDEFEPEIDPSGGDSSVWGSDEACPSGGRGGPRHAAERIARAHVAADGCEACDFVFTVRTLAEIVERGHRDPFGWYVFADLQRSLASSWIVYVSDAQFATIQSSWIVVISQSDGAVLYSGSAYDEG